MDPFTPDTWADAPLAFIVLAALVGVATQVIKIILRRDGKPSWWTPWAPRIVAVATGLSTTILAIFPADSYWVQAGLGVLAAVVAVFSYDLGAAAKRHLAILLAGALACALPAMHGCGGASMKTEPLAQFHGGTVEGTASGELRYAPEVGLEGEGVLDLTAVARGKVWVVELTPRLWLRLSRPVVEVGAELTARLASLMVVGASIQCSWPLDAPECLPPPPVPDGDAAECIAPEPFCAYCGILNEARACRAFGAAPTKAPDASARGDGPRPAEEEAAP